MSKELDFKGLADFLLARAPELLPAWLPGGREVSGEYVCGDLRGGPGTSLKVSLKKGAWSDFAGTEKGGDLISLYAAVEGIKQGEAARKLAEQYGYQLSDTPAPQRKPEVRVGAPPSGAAAPAMTHKEWGNPVASWEYKDAQGRRLFFVARYETPEGRQFLPWSWSLDGSRWIMKGWPEPRPLYGLDLLSARSEANVMVVEGEKACEAARKLAGRVYTVVTWPNGAKSPKKADWSPLFGRRVIIWPDADEAGKSAALAVAATLSGKCPEVKILDVAGMPDAWDAADALAEGWDWDKFAAWAKPRVRVCTPPPAPVVAGNVPENVPANGAKSQPTLKINGDGIVQVILGDADPASSDLHAEWDRIGIVTTKQGQPICNVDNVLRILERKEKLKSAFWYDEFYRKVYTDMGGQSRELSDVDVLNLTAAMQRGLGLVRMSDDVVYKGVTVASHRNRRNEPREWMESLKWDGNPRIEDFLHCTMGVPDSAYSRAASKNFWIGMTARVFSPGCKLDNMLVLQGGQGIYKSTALEVIGGKWYAVAKSSVLDKDFFMLLHGKLVVEIAELDAFGRAEITTIKNIVSSRADRYRTPYGRSAEDHPRASVFVGTTNEHAFLKDTTGARRFWPVTCAWVDVESIEAAREQCFAEAVARFKKGESWHEMPKGETEQEQESRRITDEWEGVISDWLTGRGLEETTVRELAVECLKIDIGKLSKLDQHRIGAVLRVLGWARKNRREDGTQTKVWVAPEKN